MRKSIDAALNLGADGLVIGVLNEMGDVNRALTRELVERAAFHPVTFHRAFDEARSQATALEAIVEAGVDRVLTGGGPGTAVEGVDMLRDLVYEALGRITIMAGGKVRADNARSLVEQTGVAELHARCELDPSRISGIVAARSQLAVPVTGPAVHRSTVISSATRCSLGRYPAARFAGRRPLAESSCVPGTR